MIIGWDITKIRCILRLQTTQDPVDCPWNPGRAVRWQGRASPFCFDVDDQVSRQELYAECSERAEETSHNCNPCRQVVDPARTEDKAIKGPKC